MGPSFNIPENVALTRLMALCSRSEKSEYDVLNKLIEWGLEDQSKKILDTLKKENYIDNFRFACAFAIDKIKFNKWGRYKVRYLLKSKHISEIDIQNALNAIDYDEYRKIVFEELRKKKSTLKTTNSFEIKSKIYAFGNQRGYENDLINEFLR
jgi:regulatory protein